MVVRGRMVGGYNIPWENIFIWVGVLNRSKFLEQKVATAGAFF
jgi:hypothetical protein